MALTSLVLWYSSPLVTCSGLFCCLCVLWPWCICSLSKSVSYHTSRCTALSCFAITFFWDLSFLVVNSWTWERTETRHINQGRRFSSYDSRDCGQVMCFRKLQSWNLSTSTAEFCQFEKDAEISREESQFVEAFRGEIEIPPVIPKWLWQARIFVPLFASYCFEWWNQLQSK